MVEQGGSGGLDADAGRLNEDDWSAERFTAELAEGAERKGKKWIVCAA